MVLTLQRARYALKARLWRARGRVPHAAGWSAARRLALENAIRRAASGLPIESREAGIDERIVEYPWLFSASQNLRARGGFAMDAGSVLNYPWVLALWEAYVALPTTLVTLAYEGHASVSGLTRYEFGDLRHLPYRDEWFSLALCISTMEHVGMDTSIYGGESARPSRPAEEAARAMRELYRVTARSGTMLLSVPFGRSADHGWLRVFDADDLSELLDAAPWRTQQARYFRAESTGWRECGPADAAGAGYNEPPGRGVSTAPAHVAAAEAVALLELKRS